MGCQGRHLEKSNNLWVSCEIWVSTREETKEGLRCDAKALRLMKAHAASGSSLHPDEECSTKGCQLRLATVEDQIWRRPEHHAKVFEYNLSRKQEWSEPLKGWGRWLTWSSDFLQFSLLRETFSTLLADFSPPVFPSPYFNNLYYRLLIFQL